MRIDLTEKQCTLLREDRGELVKRMLKQFLLVPEGYVVTDDCRAMYGNSILAIRPTDPAAGSRMIHFIHQITYRSHLVHGDFRRTPVEESIRAIGDVCSHLRKPSLVWESDPGFGVDGRLVGIVSRGYIDSGLETAARDVASKCSALFNSLCPERTRDVL